MTAAADERRRELGERLDAVHERIERACRAAGREPDDVTLVVVTKRFPASDVEELAALGVAHVGESRDQEARPKLAEVAPATRARLTVHAIGQVQTNKAGHVAQWADVVHSVDRERLVDALGRARQRLIDEGGASPLDVLLQVDLEEGADAGRGGALPEDLTALADRVAATPALRLCGVMAVAPRGCAPLAAFTRLAEVSQRLRADHPGAVHLSAGMSGDLEEAVACGATHLRVGSAILGSRDLTR